MRCEPPTSASRLDRFYLNGRERPKKLGTLLANGFAGPPLCRRRRRPNHERLQDKLAVATRERRAVSEAISR
jgi:hypothetical protein